MSVPGPTWVRSLFSSFDSMRHLRGDEFQFKVFCFYKLNGLLWTIHV